MSTDSKLIITCKPVIWLLITTFLLAAFLPSHYHLHHTHSDDAFSLATTTPEHVIDLHVLTETTGHSHHHEDATIITASPDGIVKKSNPEFFPFILLAIVLLLLPALNKKIKIQLNDRSTNLKQSQPHFTPLLRAPPLH